MKNEPAIIVQLIHLQGPLKGQIQEFQERTISIGRHPTCSVIFPKDLSSVSRNHAEIVREGNRFKLIDKSTNGTFVNGKQITEVFLKDGDVIIFSQDGPKVSFLSKIDQAEQQVEDIEPTPKAVAPGPVVEEPPAAPSPKPPEPAIPAPAEPMPAEEVPVLRVKAPLIVQYGPTLNSYKELPITIGNGPACDFLLTHPSIMDSHAQIFFAGDQYWIKDLTGKRCISINSQAIDLQAALKVNDVISLSPQGPIFRFLGQGRLAEYEEPVEEDPIPMPDQDQPMNQPEDDKVQKVIKSFKDIFKK